MGGRSNTIRFGGLVKRLRVYGLLVGVAAVLGLSERAWAQTDEIQVYTGDIADKGVFNLTVHDNFIAKGSTTPAFPGGVIANHSFNGVPEWAYGVTKWFESGLYMPLYSRDPNLGWGLNGFKLRALFVQPDNDDKKFVYGANFEFSINASRWDAKRYSSEVRPIVGWHLGTVDLIFNPILDTEYDGFGNLDFAPAERIAFNVTKTSQIAVEEYADYGPIHELLPGGQQVHQLYGVVDHTTKGGLDIEAGVGVGLNTASDRLTFKLILSHDLNKKK
jgi:hypothetical protein